MLSATTVTCQVCSVSLTFSSKCANCLLQDPGAVQHNRQWLCCCRSTNYKKWFTSAEPYAIKFRSGYEPYVLVARKIMPWYDERFRGYGWDKVKRRPCLSPSRR